MLQRVNWYAVFAVLELLVMLVAIAYEHSLSQVVGSGFIAVVLAIFSLRIDR